MIIHKILNNNAILVINSKSEEIIMTGKGIAFQKKNGDIVDESRIEKIFCLENVELKNRFQELITDIPMDCISLSEEIIHMIKQKYTKQIHDNIYVTLTDHIANLLERIQMGVVFHNMLLWDAKRIYPEEYALGEIACQMIEEQLDIHCDEEEAAFIALHIVNANMNVEIEQTMQITNLIQKLQLMIESVFPGKLHEHDMDYHRFILHLRFFFTRLLTQNAQGDSNGESTVENVLMLLKTSYPKQYDCMKNMITFIEHELKITVIRGEKLYLLIHVIKITADNGGVDGTKITG